MKEETIKEQVAQFSREWQNVTMSYSDYARSVDLSLISLQILRYISDIENCTQRTICERSYLSRQTVNTVISGFYQKGLIELRELPENRRTKSLHLTTKGQQYVADIIPQLLDAEFCAMRSLSEEQRAVLIESIQRYGEVFHSTIFQSK